MTEELQKPPRLKSLEDGYDWREFDKYLQKIYLLLGPSTSNVSGAEWGHITGVLSSQTDLHNALDALDILIDTKIDKFYSYAMPKGNNSGDLINAIPGLDYITPVFLKSHIEGLRLEYLDNTSLTISPGSLEIWGNGYYSNNVLTVSLLEIPTPSIFTASGTYTAAVDEVIDVLIVGGGGGGGTGYGAIDPHYAGGGGGGGGVRQISGMSISAGTYNVVVGEACAIGTNGNDSSFNSIIATGGGRGGNAENGVGAGQNGGSGGGAGDASSLHGISYPVTSPAQGNDGGISAYNEAGGGGGGAGGVGGNGTAYSRGGVGGVGVLSSITGSPVYYGGGGGAAAGGLGGNGGGTGAWPYANATNPTDNVGGGGGGAITTGNASGGGAGIVVIVVSYTSARYYVYVKTPATGYLITSSDTLVSATVPEWNNFLGGYYLEGSSVYKYIGSFKTDDLGYLDATTIIPLREWVEDLTINNLTSSMPVFTDTNNKMTSTGTTPVSHGGTGVTTLTDHGIILGSGTGAVTVLGNATNGQIPIGSTGADPVIATITQGTGITVTNTAGAISIASHVPVTVSAPLSVTGQALSLVNDAAATITQIDTGALSNLDTDIPTSKAVTTALASAGSGKTQQQIMTLSLMR
jgi:hypothetical protein